jgi:hypothetical protein
MTMYSAVEYLSASIPAHCGEVGTKAWIKVLRYLEENAEGSFDRECFQEWIADTCKALLDFNATED